MLENVTHRKLENLKEKENLKDLDENEGSILGNGKSVHVLDPSISVCGQTESYFYNGNKLRFFINIKYFFASSA
jgi:hypothetical protein